MFHSATPELLQLLNSLEDATSEKRAVVIRKFERSESELQSKSF